MSMRDTPARVRQAVSEGDGARGTVRAAVAAVLAPLFALLQPVVNPVRDALTPPESTQDRWESFNEWRHERPFAGGVLLLVGGLVVGWVPLQFAGEIMLIGSSLTTSIGLLFASLMVVNAGFVLAYPQFSRPLGIIGIVLSLLSLFGALGGLFVGLILGLVGGNLCLAWEQPASAQTDDDDAEPPAADTNRISDATSSLRTAISND